MKKDWQQVIKTPEERAVFKALASPKWDYRTVTGIAGSTQLDESKVKQILHNHQDLVRLASVPGPKGEDLYTLNDPTLRETLAVARGAISKSAS